MGLFYTIYRRDISKGLIRGIYKGSVYIIWGTSKDYIGSRFKVRGSILGSLYSKTKNPNSDFNGISPTNRWTNKETKPDVRTVSMTLHQLCTEQLGIIIISCIVRV